MCAQSSLYLQLTPNIYNGGYAISCHGQANGSISAQVSGGSEPYTFLWSNNATTQNLQNLSAGTYTLTVTDDANNTASQSITLIQPTALNLSLHSPLYNTYHISIAGTQTGQIDIDVQGGTPPYTYLWNNGSTSQRLYNLSAGNYFVTVTDDNGCTISNNIQLLQPEQLQINSIQATVKANNHHISCTGRADGEIEISLSGGVSPYRYNWSNGSIEQNITNAAAGQNSVVVTDANGATAQASVTLTEPDELVAETEVFIYPNGYGTGAYAHADGSAQLSVSGGSAPYSFMWSNDATTQNLQQVYGGIYECMITDAMGCSIEAVAKIKEPPFPGWQWDGNLGLNSDNYIGTNDDAPLLFKTNGEQRLFISGTGDVSLSTLGGGGNGILYADDQGQLKKWDGVTAVQGLFNPDIEVLGDCGRIVNPWQEINDGNHHIVKCPVVDNVGIGITGVPRAKLHLKQTATSSNLMLMLENQYVENGSNKPIIQFNNGLFTNNVAGVYWNISAQVSGGFAPFKITYRESGLNNGEEQDYLVINNNGNVGIGTGIPDQSYKLSVNGSIRAKEIRVNTGWSDFVFEKEYKLMPLKEVEQYILLHKHLPEIPDAETVEANGIDLGNMNKLLLQKIEELTLYVIELKKKINTIENK